MPWLVLHMGGLPFSEEKVGKRLRGGTKRSQGSQENKSKAMNLLGFYSNKDQETALDPQRQVIFQQRQGHD